MTFNGSDRQSDMKKICIKIYMDVITLLPPGGSGRKVNPSDSNNSIKHSTASLAGDSDEIEGTREVSGTSIFKKKEELW